MIFKKYSPVGELSNFASQICETLNKTTGRTAVVCDRDSVIAVSGTARRELMDKRISEELERIIESRQIYFCKDKECKLCISDDVQTQHISIAAPIISEGDVSGCVIFAVGDGEESMGDTEDKLAQTVAGFLGKQREG